MNRHSNCLQQNIDSRPQRSMIMIQILCIHHSLNVTIEERCVGAERGNNWNTSLFSCCQAVVAGGWRYVNSIRVPHINYPPVLTALVKFDRKLIKIWQNMSHRSYLQTMESVMQSGIRRLDPGPRPCSGQTCQPQTETIKQNCPGFIPSFLDTAISVSA